MIIETQLPARHLGDSGDVEGSEKANQIKEGTYDVFYGPVVDIDGNIRINKGENMPDEMLLHAFDWYVRGVNIHEE